MPTQDTDDTELNLATIETEPELDTQTTTSKGAEGENIELSLSEDKTQVAKTLSPQEIKVKQQEDSFFNKILEGEIELTAVPKWLQHRVQLRLDAISKIDDIHQIAQKVALEEISKVGQNAEFEKLKAQLPPMTKDQAKAFQAKFDDLYPLGKLKALKETMERFGYDEESRENVEINKSRSKLSLPKVGQSRAKDKEKDDWLSAADDDVKWQAKMKEVRLAMAEE